MIGIVFSLYCRSLGQEHSGKFDCYGGRAKCRSSGNETDNVTIIFVQRGYWVGPYDDEGETVTVLGFCAFCNFQSYSVGELIKIDVDNQCAKNRNQSSMLCSSCNKGYSFAINSNSYSCVKCKNKKESLYFLLNVLILTVFLLFIYFFDFSLVSGALNPLIFFGQMTSTTLNLNLYDAIPATANITNHLSYAYQTVNAFWKLDLMYSGNNFCLDESLEMVQVLALKYIVALMALVPVIALVLIAKSLDKISNSIGKGLRYLHLSEGIVITITNPCGCFRRFPWIQRAVRFKRDNSIPTLVASCILLSFIKINIITFYLLTPVNLYNFLGNVIGKVLYYQGTLQLYPGSSEYWRYAWLAIFFLVTVIILFPFTLLLLKYKLNEWENNASTRIGHIMWYLDKFLDKCLLMPFQKDLRSGKKIDGLCSKVRIWRLSFGMHDCRWYAGWYFILRSSLFASIFTMDYIEQLIIQQILIALALGLTVTLRPYKRTAHNRLDAFIFLLILIINFTVFYQYHLTVSSEHGTRTGIFVVQYILCFIPTVLIVAYFIIKLRTNWRKDVNRGRQESWRFSDSNGFLEHLFCGCNTEPEYTPLLVQPE